jgi:tetratricopeptide (TPR) repeat protein
MALVGDLDGAARGFREALAIQESIGDHEGAGFALGGLAFLAAASGDDGAAVEFYGRSTAEYSVIDDRAEVARVLGELAWVLLRLGDHAAAGARFLEAARAYRDVASARGMGTSLIGLAVTAASIGDHERATVIAAAAEVFSAGEGIVNVYADTPAGVELIARARDSLGSGLAAADARGRSMDADEVLAFAMTAL